MPDYILVHTKDEYKIAASLFKEYAEWLNIDLGFQHFESELKDLNDMYSSPDGGILICKKDEQFIACVAVRKNLGEIAELKRMFVKPAYQNQGIGKKLLEEAI